MHGGIGEDRARAAVLFIGADAFGEDGAAHVRLHPLRRAPVLQRQPRVGGAPARVNRNPAVAVFAGGVQEHPRAADLRAHDAARPRIAEGSALDLAGDAARHGGRLLQRHHAGERAGAVGARARAPHDGGVGDGLDGKAGPDHPAAERVALGHAVQRHQRAAGAGPGDAAQGHPLRGRIGAEAGGAAKEREARRSLQRIVQPPGGGQHGGIDAEDGEGRIPRRLGQARGLDDDFDGGRLIQRHAAQRPYFARGGDDDRRAAGVRGA